MKAFLGVLVLTLAGCGGGGSGTAATSGGSNPTGSPWALRSTNEAGLSAYFREALGPASKAYVGSVWSIDLPLATSAAPAASGAATVTGTFSGTTLQEAGVDEADLIKSDGTHVFDLTGDFRRAVLRRQRLNANASDAALVPVDSLKLGFSTDVRGSGLYLDSERQQVAAIAEGSTGWGIYDSWFAPQVWGQGVTEVVLADTSASTQMKQRRTLRMTAQLIGSRRVGTSLYLVMRSYPRIPGLDPSWPTAKSNTNQVLLDALQSPQLLPTLSIDGASAQALVDPSSCFTQADNAVKSADVITIVGIDLASATHRHAARCFTGGTEAFYMSDQSLYLATTRTAYSYSGAFPVYAGQASTDIHKFGLAGLDISYLGSGNVTGHLGFDQNRKSFRMGEHLGALRVISQTSPSWGGWSSPGESPGHLTILQEKAGALVVIGELPNASRPAPLGKTGEQLYASRFVGSRGYLVTYRLTDPLYILDLANPADPKIAGELQVDGYSDYLFPLTDTLLLGVGKDAIADGGPGDGRFAWYQGVKVSLIDLSDPARPREAARTVIGRRGTDASALHNHHGLALQTIGKTSRISLPIRLHDTATPGLMPSSSNYFQFTRTELQRFDIDLTKQTLVSRAPLASSITAERDIGDDRSLLWNEQVHYFRGGGWQSAAW